MHLKSTICLSCQPAVIFINNSKNILWDSFCFEIQSCDSFHSREHWVNCNVLTCQWMVPCRAKLVMNWYLLRPKQAQGTTSIPSSMSPAMMDRSEEQQRPRRERCELTSKQRHRDCFHQPTEAVVSCVTYCCSIILPCTPLMDLLYHGAGWTLECRRKNRRYNSPQAPQEGFLSQAFSHIRQNKRQTPHLERPGLLTEDSVDLLRSFDTKEPSLQGDSMSAVTSHGTIQTSQLQCSPAQWL